MTLPGRRLKKYHPRRSRKLVKIQKQLLSDIEHNISLELGKLIVMSEAGNTEQVYHISNILKQNLQKYGSQMERLAQEMKGLFPKAVHEYLTSIENLTKCSPGWIEEEKVSRCIKIRERLQKLIRIDKKETEEPSISQENPLKTKEVKHETYSS